MGQVQDQRPARADSYGDLWPKSDTRQQVLALHWLSGHEIPVAMIGRHTAATLPALLSGDKLD
jgi:hypothetical protein